MPLYLVMIRDKELLGEPFVAFGVFEADDEDAAGRAAALAPDLAQLAAGGRWRCHPVVQGELRSGKFYPTRKLGRLDQRPIVAEW